ncbi:Wzz/FepE/Etk N-terminal domain-containing protein, partial [Halomonas sp. CS7]
MTAKTTQTPADERIDLGRIFGLVLDHKWLIIGITLLFALGGAANAILTTPIYQGDALVQVERKSTLSPLGDLANVMGTGEDTGNVSAAEVQILQSRMVLGQVVDRIGLDTVVVPRLLPIVGEFVLRQNIERPDFMEGRPEVWGGESLRLGRLEVADPLRGSPLIVTAGERGAYTLTLGGEKPRVLGQGQVG